MTKNQDQLDRFTGNEERQDRYHRQNGTQRLTPKQRRRLLHKRAAHGTLPWMEPPAADC